MNDTIDSFFLNSCQHFGNFKPYITVSECCLIKLLLYILLEKNIDIYILALEMTSPGNRHRASCIGTFSFLGNASTYRPLPDCRRGRHSSAQSSCDLAIVLYYYRVIALHIRRFLHTEIYSITFLRSTEPEDSCDILVCRLANYLVRRNRN